MKIPPLKGGMKKRIKQTPKEYKDAEGRLYENPSYSLIIEKNLKYVKKSKTNFTDAIQLDIFQGKNNKIETGRTRPEKSCTYTRESICSGETPKRSGYNPWEQRSDFEAF